MNSNKIEITLAAENDDFSKAKQLIKEYVVWLGFDLSFQNFDSEINDLRSMYFKPTGGLLIATVNGEAAGVAGIRHYQDHECELKRMFVKEAFRNMGIGQALLTRSIVLAKELGYTLIKLDTADFMKSAVKLYQSHGFVEIGAYRHNPQQDARYFELDLKNG